MSEIPAPCETKIGSDSQTMCVHVNRYGVGQFCFLFFSVEFGFSRWISSPVCHLYFLEVNDTRRMMGEKSTPKWGIKQGLI